MPLPKIPPALQARLIKAGAVGAVAVAGVMMSWFESSDKPHPVPYLDTGGVLTVCDGHTGRDIIPNHVYTPTECAALKDKDLAEAAAAVDRHLTAPTSVWMRGALIDFTINNGEGKLASSTLLAKTNAGDEAGACAEYDRWVKGTVGRTKVTLPGLVKRADAREWLCLQP